MGATERIVVQVTRDEKRQITTRAKRLGYNVSELMREAAQNFSPAEDDSEVLALIDRVNASTAEANAAMEGTLSAIAESEKRIEAMMKKGVH